MIAYQGRAGNLVLSSMHTIIHSLFILWPYTPDLLTSLWIYDYLLSSLKSYRMFLMLESYNH